MAKPRQLVSPPDFTPTPYGLLTVVQTPTPGNSHWENGVTYVSSCTITMGATTYEECIAITGNTDNPPPPAPTMNTSTIGPSNRGATPIRPIVEFDCSPVGNEDAQAIAERALAQSASWQVERAFWTGKVGAAQIPAVWPHLAANTQVLDSSGILLQSPAVTGGALTVDIVDGLGYLEQQLADCYNGVGIIHIPPRVLPTLDAWGLVKKQGNALTTLNGNRIAVGAGYPGTSPSGAAPAVGTAWIYATGAVFGYSSPVRITGKVDSFDKAENTIRMIAQRTFVLGWDCCHAGALVSVGVPIDGIS